MSLSGALSNAMSGLTANARGTTVVSSNIANALNEHYGRRDLVLSANATQSSGGVNIAGVERSFDPILAHHKRHAIASHASATVAAKFGNDLEQLVGSVDTARSLSDRLTRLETALISAASDPSSETRLRNISHSAEAFSADLRAASHGIDTLRANADAQIATFVDALNSGLSQLEQLNSQIMIATHLGQDVHGLMDQRDATLDILSEIVPVRVVQRESGVVAIFTTQGRTLLDDTAATFSFVPSPTTMPHMTVANGLLSRLQIDGNEIDIPGSGRMTGGALEAQFLLRDKNAPAAQERLDAIAREAVELFGPGGPDPTLGPGDAGTFTDAGSAFLPTDQTGLAGRITLNSALAASSGEIWRWRDGINASVQGDVGESNLLLALRDQVVVPKLPASGILGDAPRGLVDHVQEMSNGAAATRVRSSEILDTASAQLNHARQAVAVDGVNTDQELQKLIELEKSYAANARVVQVVDDMLSELLKI
ncbi:flagellar basal body rod C-terminal domain-containing protein [Marivita sp. XM-24bin2]|jgi:flagellar hook-associated protein 1 FlgK|uniref:FlgK family flagellar hook-associated protein n=1 Tax=unclassified Marivita TaxID=2632480 RepID=UPI000D7B89B8|nr:flagellar basal body rod C-terminal domain-containing protein [Marivita sp. XM-24bin2]MCR9111340.1 flagellar hook-associated protein FlgK [Paracoccaceae bacterium]PWL36251.1 MAG: flagellar hook-associated protein FlgK [Marivita sp. XM-24bin2]